MKKKNKFGVVYAEEILMMKSWKSAAKSVYLGLCLYMKTTEKNGIRTRKCHPSHNSLMEKTGLSQTTISKGIKYLKELHSDGITEVTYEKVNGKRFISEESKNKDRFLTTIQRMGTSAQYIVSYRLHTVEDTELPTVENTEYCTVENTELPTVENTELPTVEKQTNNDNKQLEHTIVTDDTINHHRDILNSMCSFFGWSTDKVEEYVAKYSDNEHFANELILVACHQFKRDGKGERYWTKNYWPRGLDRWMDDAPSPRSAINETLVERVHKEILKTTPAAGVSSDKVENSQNIDDDIGSADLDNISIEDFKKLFKW